MKPKPTKSALPKARVMYHNLALGLECVVKRKQVAYPQSCAVIPGPPKQSLAIVWFFKLSEEEQAATLMRAMDSHYGESFMDDAVAVLAAIKGK